MNYNYDATLEQCPLPLVKLRVILKKMQPGDVCMIRISDNGSKKDIPKLLKKYGYHFTESTISSSTVELTIPYRKIT